MAMPVGPHVHIDASEPWFEHPKARRGPLPGGCRLSSERGETRVDGGAADFRGAVHSNQLAFKVVGHVRMGSSRQGRSHIDMGVCYERAGQALIVVVLFYSCIIIVTFCETTICHVYHACHAAPDLRAETTCLHMAPIYKPSKSPAASSSSMSPS